MKAYFDGILDTSLKRLHTQRAEWHTATPGQRQERWRRALYFSSLCINRSWASSIAIWEKRGSPAMPSAIKFLERHSKKTPYVRECSPKLNFARALAGSHKGRVAVCEDRWVKRMGWKPETAHEQWRLWLGVLGPRLWGRARAALVVHQHAVILDWILTGYAATMPRSEEWKQGKLGV